MADPPVVHAPISLVTIKEDLGITDDAQDSWLQRRIDGIWSRIETYCARRLVAPPASFVDDWGEIAQTGVTHNQPPALENPRVSSVFLRCFPVVEITAVEINGAETATPIAARFDKRSGKLFSLDASQTPHDVSQSLRSSAAKITYRAGWDAVPSDLYEALLGALQILWAQRSGQTGSQGAGGGVVSGITVQDVGQIEFGASNVFVDSATRNRGAGAADPLLGPFVVLLDPYVDYRVLIGSPLLPTTTELPPVEPPP